MRERAEMLLKVLCGALVVLLLFQTGRALMHTDPFAHVNIPSLPTLAGDTNAPAGGSNSALAKVTGNVQTNSNAGTNHLGTNAIAKLTGTNLPAGTNHDTNLPPALAVGTTATNSTGPTNTLAATNTLSLTNLLAMTNAPTSTNLLAQAGQTNAGPMGPGHGKRPSRSHGPMMGSFPGMGGMGGPGKPLPELPAVARARIDKIVASELLGPVPHPEPKALLGIAGEVAFLRSDSGETGLAKVGESVGDLKVLRIGINRVLIEQNGEKLELTIFDGMGGESLLTTSDKNSNENNKH